MKLDILSITPEKLRKGTYSSIFEEYYALVGVVDNNPWHENQNVFDHVVAVFDGLMRVLRFDYLDTQESHILEKYLTEKVGYFTRKEILYMATLLHDISKIFAVIRNEETQKTTAPGHEVLSSAMTVDIAPRFGFTGKDLIFLQRIVLYHGFLHDIINLILAKGEEDRFFIFLTHIGKDVVPELLLLGYADMLGSDLFRLDKKAFDRREKLLIHLIKRSL